MFGVSKHEHSHRTGDHKKHDEYMSMHGSKNPSVFSLTRLPTDNGATFPTMQKRPIYHLQGRRRQKTLRTHGGTWYFPRCPGRTHLPAQRQPMHPAATWQQTLSRPDNLGKYSRKRILISQKCRSIFRQVLFVKKPRM